jgi:L-ascorbate metabolism protein UlaG (beta-lactamase superfamily)
MHFRLIRNATFRLNYAGRLLLMDPFLAPKHSLPAFDNISPNPIVDLPCAPQEVLQGVECVVLSHLHGDHFDQLAQELLPKNTTIYCQPGDETRVTEAGFLDVNPVEHFTTWQGIKITRTPGQHGTGFLAEQMGQVSGFVFQAPGEPTLYWAGDTIWYEEIAGVIDRFAPDIIMTHSSGARFGDSDPIVMDAEQTIALCQKAAAATVIAIHMESLEHGRVTRAELAALAEASGLRSGQLLIPADGETIALNLEEATG